MASSSSVPWYNRSARPFPVHLWMRQRYGFRVPPLHFVPQTSQPEGPRPFPAKVWLMQRQQQGTEGKTHSTRTKTALR